jgi:hypothetical protein
LSTSAIANLSTTQINSLTATDISNLSTTNLAALTTTQIAALSATQLIALTTAQVSTLNTTTLGAITSTKIASLEAADVAGVLVGYQGDARARKVDGVDGVKELGLSRRLVGEKMNIVDGQEVDPAQAFAELVERAIADGGDVLVGELLGGDILDHLARTALSAASAEALDEVRLSHAALAVDEEDRRRLGRTIADLIARGEGEAI